MTSTTDIITAILDGSTDSDLDAIVAAAKERKAVLSRVAFFTVDIGAKATLKNLRPKYLVGAPVTVTGKKQTRIEVRIDEDWFATRPNVHKWRGPITATPDMLDLIEA